MGAPPAAQAVRADRPVDGLPYLFYDEPALFDGERGKVVAPLFVLGDKVAAQQAVAALDLVEPVRVNLLPDQRGPAVAGRGRQAPVGARKRLEHALPLVVGPLQVQVAHRLELGQLGAHRAERAGKLRRRGRAAAAGARGRRRRGRGVPVQPLPGRRAVPQVAGELADHAPHLQACLDAGPRRPHGRLVRGGRLAELVAYRPCVAAPLEAQKAAAGQVPVDCILERPLPRLVRRHGAGGGRLDHAVEQAAQPRGVARSHVGKAAAARPRGPRRVEPPVRVLHAVHPADELVQARPVDGQPERGDVQDRLVGAVGRGVQPVRARPAKVPLAQGRAEADQELYAAVHARGRLVDAPAGLGDVQLGRVGLDRGEQLLVHAPPVLELALYEHRIVGQPDASEALPDHLQGGPLLAHDEHLPARRQGVCDQVYDDLRLARPGRAPHDAQVVGRGPQDHLVLARVAVKDGVEARRAGRVYVDAPSAAALAVLAAVRVAVRVAAVLFGRPAPRDERADHAGGRLAGPAPLHHLRVVPVDLAVGLGKASDHGVPDKAERGSLQPVDVVRREGGERHGARLGRRRADVDEP